MRPVAAGDDERIEVDVQGLSGRARDEGRGAVGRLDGIVVKI